MKRYIEKKGLLIALISGLFVRTCLWLRSEGLLLKDGNIDLDDYLAVSKVLFTAGENSSVRPTQLAYPLLLYPIHLFGISAQLYVFLLHSLLYILLVLVSFNLIKKIKGQLYAVITAFAVALNPFPLIFFNWMFTDTCYYTFVVCLIASFVNAVFSVHKIRASLVFCLFAVLTMLLKPEGVVPVIACFSILGVHFIYLKTNSKWLSVSTVLSFLLLVIATTYTYINSSENLRSKILSNLHVAHGFWLSTHTVANPHGYQQTHTYLEELPKFAEGSKDLPDAHRRMSLEGISLIKARPFLYLKNAIIRGFAILFPWYFRGWESFWTAKEIVFTLFTFLGALLAFLLNRKNFVFQSISLIAFAMLTFVSFYVNDGNLRFRVPIQCVLFLIAPSGWIDFYLYLKKTYLLFTSNSELLNS